MPVDVAGLRGPGHLQQEREGGVVDGVRSHGCASGRDASLSSGSSPSRHADTASAIRERDAGRSLGRPTLTASAPYAAYSATVSRPRRRC